MSKEKFEPRWPDEPNENDVYLPDDLDSRTPHPQTAPKAVFDIISSTYYSRSKLYNDFARFKLFPKLPTELRRIIWRLSLPGQRVVEVLFDNFTGQCRSSCPIPIALHVSSEARGVALESYELAFGTAEAEAVVYFDFKIDALFLGLGNFAPSSWDPARYFFRKLQSIDLCRLQHIMIQDTMRSLYPGFDGINGSPTNLGGFQDGIGSEGDTMENNVSEFRLKSLVALTIISHGNMDVVIQKTEGGDGEFHTWDILDDGKPMPWLLAENDSTVKAMRVSQIWRLSELAKDTGATSLTTVRSVGMKRLRTDKVWAKRVAFLDQHILPGGFNACFYPKDGVLARVLEMEFSQPHLYDELNEYLRIDPEYLYIEAPRSGRGSVGFSSLAPDYPRGCYPRRFPQGASCRG
ncbi:hypothetical protein L207DRAFT_207124 [Hyaloscypha variabilis F]|uniref:2EXR domain-containing protein n=1 Tax=Hyaloscypha variabilis (strain UAMH 11265 / GT02V1 / F) TaxID=1149755 RepID=A0A2J6S618_HYAVF|nr:hypothetical protein L207DRAFT_207124 [Hyaloscypha variabilis F]